MNGTDDSETVAGGRTMLEWGEPPPVLRGPRKVQYDGILVALRSRPNVWAKVWEGERKSTKSVRYSLRKRGCVTAQRVVRSGEGRRVAVWAMFPEGGAS